MLQINLEILDKKRQYVFKKLSAFAKEGYLAGGTALSLQLAHRKSFDFDVFVNKQIDNKIRLKIKKFFPNCKFELNTSDQVDIETNEGIKITFLWYYFPLLKPPIKTFSLSLASIEDIAADKAHAIGRRAVWRDYVDLFFVLKLKKISLKDIINLAKKKFKNEFNSALFLDQLTYFEDIKFTKIEFIKKKYSESTIKKYLEKAVQEYNEKYLLY